MGMTIGYECRTEVSYHIEWEIGDFVLVDHSIRCVVPSAEVRDEPKVYCVWLGYDVDGHSIHAKGEHESGSSTSTCGFIRGKPTGQVTHRSEFLNGTGLHRSG